MATPRKSPGMNPRDKRPGERRSLMPNRPGGAVWYILGLLFLLALAQAWFMAPAGQPISYSEFKQAVRAGQVAEVFVGDQSIRGTYKRDTNGGRTFNTAGIEDPKLIEGLDTAGVKYTGEMVSRWVPEVLGWVVPLLLLFAVWSFFFRRMSGAEGGVMSFARSKHRVFSEDDVKVSFADVAGVDEAEQELKEVVEFLRTPKKYTTLGGRIPKGVLLVGPPGTGKTLLARAVAGEAKVPFFSLSGSEFVEMFVGVGAARVRDLFSQAEAKAPCIIFIDELDALGRARVQSPMGSHEEREQTLNQLLAEMADFDEAIDRLIAGLEKKRVMSQKEREIVAYHESGHAIVATAIPGMDPVHKISIVQRGFGALGYTMQLPLEDRYLMQRRDLLNQLAVLLGGRTAEEIALGEISTGAQNDLQRATDIARAMVTEWGMSDALGAINYDGHKRSKFLDIPIGPERGAYAEETGRLIDSEVKRIMTDAHEEARRILSGRREMLERVTRRLLEIEVMEGEQLRQLMGITPAPPTSETIPLPTNELR